ncbi:DNA replication/repair protein RecF [Alkaliphilus oremlandii]|uniref:DNA replication and repair protein RecF n=1 Tax=Alkaliphilus oremlandii (strain OhILAs) TaxID=350688 RepID=RECF_ALKOO|nr:DNA replication/repair protein RecF [Alkaliphilus oremlandii]A8MEA3.1 RecName: Full=DNA replication and repair protein RecF [Alkaliphilus oremlandii OhILAs]ABW17574.1 DNA replication and repair protein RecF [Alkaliphilus oremlandii OhILAs]
MIVEELKLINYRNYEQMNLKFHPRLNVFIGDNAQGKTNLIESIYLCSAGKSFRTNHDQELINMNKKQAYIHVKVKKVHSDVHIEVRLNSERKKDLKVNQIPLVKMGELLGNLNVVLFSPEDLKLVKEGPSERRRFMDREISQISTKFYYTLSQYNKILQHRNKLLKYNKGKEIDIEVWDEQLAAAGAWLIVYRRNFIKKISILAKLMHRKITESIENLEVIYEPNVKVKENDEVDVIKEKILQNLKENFNVDKQRGLTTCGPHRDDMILKINGLDVKTYGSQGQQRTAVLSLKLAELELVKGEVGEYPILLLDDVMSELDSKRQHYLIHNLKSVQTFITTTMMETLKDLKPEDRAVFYVNKGQID